MGTRGQLPRDRMGSFLHSDLTPAQGQETSYPSQELQLAQGEENQGICLCTHSPLRTRLGCPCEGHLQWAFHLYFWFSQPPENLFSC